MKVNVHGETMLTAAEGNGPVNALDNALRKALVSYYPSIQETHLTDYKVRVIDDQGETASKVRVVMEHTDFDNTWNTVGVSSNIIEASWLALTDSIRYALLGKECRGSSHEAHKERLGLANH